jgi:hypothetical protein
MLFLLWYDDSSKTPVADKIQAAMAAYVRRFQASPSLVLVNAIDYMEREDILVRSARTVQPNTFWVGLDDIDHPTLQGEVAPAPAAV